MKVKVNEGCLGCGACTGICPDVFELDDEGLAKVIVEEGVKVVTTGAGNPEKYMKIQLFRMLSMAAQLA